MNPQVTNPPTPSKVWSDTGYAVPRSANGHGATALKKSAHHDGSTALPEGFGTVDGRARDASEGTYAR